MTDGRSRWSDDRLDDLALTVRSLHDLPNKMVDFEARLGGLEEDVGETRDGIKALIRRLDRRDEERKQEQADGRKERRADRRAFIAAAAVLLTAIIGAAGAILAAGAHP